MTIQAQYTDVQIENAVNNDTCNLALATPGNTAGIYQLDPGTLVRLIQLVQNGTITVTPHP